MVKIFNKYFFRILIFSLFIIACSYNFVQGAEEDLVNSNEIYTAKIIDNINLYSQEEEKLLTEKIIGLEETYNINILILTVDDTLGYEAHEYAGEIYDKIHRINSDGIVLVLYPEDRTIGISTSGSLLDKLNDDKVATIRGEIIDAGLKTEEYYKATLKFLDKTDEELRLSNELHENNVVSNEINSNQNNKTTINKSKEGKFANLKPLHFILPLIISGIISLIFYFNVKSSYGGSYNKEKFNLDANSTGKYSRNEDVLVNTYVTSVKNKSSDNNSGGSTGNFTSSSGGRHGGGSSKY